MIHLDNVHKRYARIHAVKGVSIHIPRGQVVGILGPNGAGKSTTIRMITGLIPPSSGTVSVDSLDSVSRSRDVRRRLGYLPESAPLYPEMRVTSYLRYRAALYDIPRRRRAPAAERAAERCRLRDVARQRIGTLSKGYRQRVGLAAALLHDPPVLILDEPTSALDPAQVAETRSVIRDLAGQRTMLLVSHILPEVEKTCDRIIIFSRGRVRADGHPASLVNSAPRDHAVIAEVRSPDSAPATVPPALASLPGLVASSATALPDGWARCLLTFTQDSAPDARRRVYSACAADGLILRELRAHTASLEEYYIRLLESDDTPAQATP